MDGFGTDQVRSLHPEHCRKPMNTPSSILAPARDLLTFVNASPSPYHAVAEATERLKAAGFTRLLETEDWVLEPGHAHYVTRSDASIIAFRVGSLHPVEAGF